MLLALGPEPSRVAHAAMWELAFLLANDEDPERTERALQFASEVVTRRVPGLDASARVVLLSELLCRTGRATDAAAMCRAALQRDAGDVDILLAYANTFLSRPAPFGITPDVALSLHARWFARAFEVDGLAPPRLAGRGERVSLDALSVDDASLEGVHDGPLASVIVPVHNAASFLPTSLRSILGQTWRNLELIVVDDASTDDSLDVIRSIVAGDRRVTVVESESNMGPYAARNRGLRMARGEFVTTHDADDWSHPRKIELQVRHLMETPAAIANMSEHIRASSELVVSRRGVAGFYLFPNISSLMFRRSPVLERVGYWDEVRFGADSEFKLRLEAAFGVDAIHTPVTGVVSILREHEASLTAQRYTGYHGYRTGVRHEYIESARHWHANAARSLRLDRAPGDRRPFPVPRLMTEARSSANAPTDVDVVLVSDFRMDGGTTSSNVAEIEASRALGLRVGLVQADYYNMNPSRETNPKIRVLIDGERVRMHTFGERVRTDLVIVRLPMVLGVRQSRLPDIETKAVRIIVNQTPRRGLASDAEVVYDMAACDAEARRLFGVEPVWHAIGPMAREGMLKEGAVVTIAPDDWVNLISVDAWRRPRWVPRRERIVIGRHARDHVVKWPTTTEELLGAYPTARDISVRVLGGADVPALTLGSLPSNWDVHAFGAMDPRTFLADLDFFVFFTNPQAYEAFGRSIFEAMAVGVPVVLPHRFETVFGAAATYSDPAGVEALLRAIRDDGDRYQSLVERGLAFVQAGYGVDQHRRRLEPLITRMREA